MEANMLAISYLLDQVRLAWPDCRLQDVLSELITLNISLRQRSGHYPWSFNRP